MTMTSGSDKHVVLTSFSGEHASKEDEAGYLRKQLPSSQRQLIRAFGFCSIFFVGFALADVAALGYGHAALVLFCARLTAVLIAYAGILFMRANAHSVPVLHLVATAAEAATMLMFLVIVCYRPDDMLLHGMSMTIIVTIVYVFVPNRLAYSIGVTLAATVAFLVLAGSLGQVRPSQLFSMTLLLLLANLFGAVTARRYGRLSRVRVHTQQVLTNMSVLDHLTGCFNRRYLNEQLLDAEISRARRYRLKLSLVMCDIDHFKSINDTFGHHAGDTVLCAFANLLREMTRDGVDAVVRYGGEEFVVILPETGVRGGVEFAERVRSSFEAAPHLPNGLNRAVTTASFGVVSVDFAQQPRAVTQHALVEVADKLMYEAKNGGRNQVRAVQFS